MKILIAEDDLTSRRILTAMLTKWGFNPVVTADGNAAWAELQQTDAPKLVLLDRNMPGLDGLELCRRLRKVESSDPPYVVLLTGLGAKDDIVQGLDAGANDYVTKPYDSEELQARIRVGQRMLELQARLLEARNALEHLAMYDSLTGLFNRRAILERLAQEISRAKREDGNLSVGMLDIDHFKNVNDACGHQVGDEVLIAFTERIRAQLRAYDCVGRYGGEEFLAITASPRGRVEGDLYERLRANVAGPIPTRAGPIFITVSIGVARSTGASTVDELLAAADVALYQAKAAGRNRVVFADRSDT
jgi:diguanylate cyclase (GGDEF)-like protein